jgi:hypothetical protein
MIEQGAVGETIGARTRVYQPLSRIGRGVSDLPRVCSNRGPNVGWVRQNWQFGIDKTGVVHIFIKLSSRI